MQSYSETFAQIYNAEFAHFTRRLGPRIVEYFATLLPTNQPRSLLDLCCGTGLMSGLFLAGGWHVHGIDLSEWMIGVARTSLCNEIASGSATFEVQDASDLHLSGDYDAAVATDDAINHLESLEDIRSCLLAVRKHVRAGGIFLFDLNTIFGLSQLNMEYLRETPTTVTFWRSIYDVEASKCLIRITGFFNEASTWTRFSQQFFSYGYPLSEVSRALAETGWSNVSFVHPDNLNEPLTNPEDERVVVVIARP